MANTDPAIHARKVTKAYGTKTVLQDVDLTVEEGEVVCIIGPSGSGKSTLLRALAHLAPHNGGEIHIFGREIGWKGGRNSRLRSRKKNWPRPVRRLVWCFSISTCGRI